MVIIDTDVLLSGQIDTARFYTSPIPQEVNQ